MKRMAERTWRGRDKEEESKGYIIRVNIHIKVLVWPCQLLQYWKCQYPQYHLRPSPYMFQASQLLSNSEGLAHSLQHPASVLQLAPGLTNQWMASWLVNILSVNPEYDESISESKIYTTANFVSIFTVLYLPLQVPSYSVFSEFSFALFLLHLKTSLLHSTSKCFIPHLDHCSSTQTSLPNSPFFSFNLCSERESCATWNSIILFSLHETEPCISVRKVLGSPEEM